MDDSFDNYYFYFDDGMEDTTNVSFPYPKEIMVPWSSWDGLEASNDDWLDTMLWIKSLKEVRI